MAEDDEKQSKKKYRERFVDRRDDKERQANEFMDSPLGLWIVGLAAAGFLIYLGYVVIESLFS